MLAALLDAMLLSTCLAADPASVSAEAIFPPSGTVFREATVQMKDNAWRVIQPDTNGEEAQHYLPNPVITVPGVDLTEAVSANLLMEFWNGHLSTVGKRFRLNGKTWIPFETPLHGTIPGRENEYAAQLSLAVPIPLAHLVAGDNRLEGTCGTNAWNWGQWGWYCGVIRTVCAPSVKPLAARIVMPAGGATIADNPVIELAADDPSAITAVRFFAWYDGLDEGGDGVGKDWHGMLRRDGWEGHVGSLTAAPWQLTWDTTWLPDQPASSIKLVAHVQDRRGLWTVTPVVDGLTLKRSHTIQLYRSQQVDLWAWVRDGVVKSSIVAIPFHHDLAKAESARLSLRSWNVENNEIGHTPLRINSGPWLTHLTGPGHWFHDGLFTLDPKLLQTGHNLLTFTSTTKHHGCEIMWPGPAILVRYPSLAALAAAPVAATGH